MCDMTFSGVHRKSVICFLIMVYRFFDLMFSCRMGMLFMSENGVLVFRQDVFLRENCAVSR